jgi:hypothetical protein
MLTCGLAATARADDAGDDDAAVVDAAFADTAAEDALDSAPSADANDEADSGAIVDATSPNPDASDASVEIDAGGIDAGEIDAGEIDAGEIDAGEIDGAADAALGDATTGEAGAVKDAASSAPSSAPSTALDLPSESCDVSNGPSPDVPLRTALFYGVVVALMAIRLLRRRPSVTQ